MSNISKNDLKIQSSNTYPNNNAGLITPDNVRAFNTDLIDSLAAQDDFTALSASYAGLSGSYAVDDASIASLNSATSSYITNAQTASMAVASAVSSSYALTASYALNGGSGGGTVDTSSLVNTASFGAYTASVSNRATTGSNTFNDDNTFERNLTVLGTASINYLNANVISQSILFSSGSNILGDSLLDVQQLTGSVGVFGTFTVYGEVDLSGSFEGDLDGTASLAISSAYAEHAFTAVTASHVNLENDVVSYKNQTGIIEGGILSIGAGNNKFTVSAGKAQIISQSLDVTGIKTSKTITQWSTQTNIDLDYLLTNPVTFVYIDGAGDVYQQTSSFVPADYRTKICLGSITHADNLYIDSVENDQIVAYNSYKPDEIVNIYGVSKLKGFQMYPISGTYGLTINSGSVYHNGANYANDQWNSNTREIIKIETASFTRVHQSGSEYIFDNSASLFGPDYYTALDADHYVDLNTGLLMTASVGYFTVQRIYQHPENPSKLFAYYGPQEYSFVDDAVNAIAFEKFEESDATKYNTLFLGYAVLKQGGNSLVSPNDGVIIYSGINRSIFLSTGTNIGALATPLTALTYCFNAPAVTWSLQHNLQVDYPIVNAYKSGSKEIVIPNTIKSIDSNMIDLYFAYPFAGCVTVAAAGAQIIQAPFQPGGLPTQSFNTWTGSVDSQFSGTASYAITASYALNAAGGGNSISASWASSSLSSSLARTASYAETASYVETASFAQTASFVRSASYAERSRTTISASYSSASQFSNFAFSAVSSSASFNSISSSYAVNAQNANVAISSSYALSASFAPSASYSDFAALARTASFSQTASIAITASHALRALTSSNADTASTADNFVVRNTLRVIGVLSASLFYAESSSVAFTSGSNRIGNALTDTQALTGSVGVTGSFVMNAVSRAIIPNLTGSLFGTASFTLSSSYAVDSTTSSYVSGSSILVQDTIAVGTGSVKFLKVTASAILGTANTNLTHSIFGMTEASGTNNLRGQTLTYGTLDLRNSFVTGTLTGYVEGSSSYAVYASESVNAVTASRILGELVIGTVTSSLSASLAVVATNAVTASRITGSGVIGIVNESVTSSISVSASFATTASFVRVAQSASWISGSNVVGTVDSSFSASLAVTASNARTASFVVLSQTASFVDTARTASFTSGAVLNFPDPFPTTAVVNNIVTLTSAEYTALTPKNANTFYVII
jgi:hypothetical protein